MLYKFFIVVIFLFLCFFVVVVVFMSSMKLSSLGNYYGRKTGL